jgi:replicative DNA helicase
MNARATEHEMAGVAQLRVPPSAIDSETSLLGALLLDNRGWDVIGDIVTEADFYRHEHKLIFTAIAALINASKPADVVTVYEQLGGTGKAEDVGGLGYLQQLAQYVPSVGNMRRYAETVREMAMRRLLIAASDEVATAAFNRSQPFEELFDQATSRITQLFEDGAKGEEWGGMDGSLTEFLNRIQSQADGTAVRDFFPTGLADLDERLDGGMRPGELIVLGARPSMGKSALGLTIAVNVAVAERKAVGFISMEMPRAQLVNRMMSLVSHIHLSRLKRAERLRDTDWPSITEGVEKLRQTPVFISDASNLNINQVRARARGLRRRQGSLACMVVDYLGLMAGTDPKMPRVYQLEEITKGLKSLAKELQIPIILLCQVKRGVEERVDQMPLMSDLRDSGSIEQDADVVMFVHREAKAKHNLGPEWKNHAKLSIAKVRDGEPGLLDLWYVGENTHFTNWPSDQELPTSPARVKKGTSL